MIDQAVKTIRFFLASFTLGNTNSVKIAELEDRLVSSLRKAVDGKDVESSAFEEDELLALKGWVARIEKLYSVKDISTTLDDTDDGKHSSAWEIVDSLVERGRLGYKDEMAVSSDAASLLFAADQGSGQLVVHAIGILGAHLVWSITKIAQPSEDVPDYAELASVVERRAALLEKFEELAVGTTSNAGETVKQAVRATCSRRFGELSLIKRPVTGSRHLLEHLRTLRFNYLTHCGPGRSTCRSQTHV